MAALIVALLNSGDARFPSGSRLARELGLSQGYLNKVVNGERDTVGLRAIESVVRKLPISRDYFYVPGPPAIDHRPFLHRIGRDVQFDRWEQFLQTDVGAHLTPAEEEVLRSPDLELPRGAALETLRAVVLAYRTGQRHHAATAREGVPTPPKAPLRALRRQHHS